MSISEQIIIKKNISTDRLNLPEFAKHELEVDVLRLDKMHPVISGNKWFKLKNYLQDALQKKCHTLVTFGGAYSNHIVATACAAKTSGLQSIGIIRGEEPKNVSHTLQTAISYGMQLFFVSREDYKRKDEPDVLNISRRNISRPYIIPEGGAGIPGIKGSEEIFQWVEKNKYNHILCAIGTGTMYMGLANELENDQYITGIPVLKGMPDLLHQFKHQLGDPEKINYCRISCDYHFGGYAKKNEQLTQFMNRIYEKSGIPTDFVYTAKLFYAAVDLASKNYFPARNRVLLIHSGGLQGNGSLPPGTLNF